MEKMFKTPSLEWTFVLYIFNKLAFISYSFYYQYASSLTNVIDECKKRFIVELGFLSFCMEVIFRSNFFCNEKVQEKRKNKVMRSLNYTKFNVHLFGEFIW